MNRRKRLQYKAGLDQFINDCTILTSETQHLISEAVYDGAGLVYNAYKDELVKIPTDPRVYVPEGYKKRGPTEGQKQCLIRDLGIAHFRYENGATQTKVGMDGYNNVQTWAWPRGQPNVLIARQLVNGTSWMHPYDFIGRAKRAISGRVEAIMASKFKTGVNTKMSGRA